MRYSKGENSREVSLMKTKLMLVVVIAENLRSLKQQFTVFKLHYQKFFQGQNFLILEETKRSSYLFLFCALQPSRYLPQEIKVIILASISNSECSDTGLFWLRMWVFLKWSMVITDVLMNIRKNHFTANYDCVLFLEINSKKHLPWQVEYCCLMNSKFGPSAFMHHSKLLVRS